MKEVHDVLINLWLALDRACKQLHLNYYAIHGTLLGTVRHQGFIPWDDDMDFVMPREDFDCLVLNAELLFPPPYFLQTEDSDRGCYFGGYARLMDETTTCMDFPNVIHSCHQGIRIDIMPLDHCSSGWYGKKINREIRFLQKVLYAKYYPAGAGVLSNLSITESARLAEAVHLLPGRWIRKRLQKLYRGKKDSKLLTISTCLYGENPNSNIYPVNWFEQVIWLMFEGHQMPVPAGYDEILKKRYGEDYYLLPVPEKRDSLHRCLMDPSASYQMQDRNQVLMRLKTMAQFELVKYELRE